MNQIMKVLKKGGLIIPKEYPEMDSLKQVLTYTGQGWDGEEVSFKMYEEMESGDVIIPRFFPIEDIEIVDKSCVGELINIQSKIRPRSKRQKQCIDHLLKSRNTILKLETGCGKTVITIDAICKNSKKTIIFVNKDSLRKNWKDEFLLHTNITENNISYLNTKKFKEQLKSPIIISTIQAFLACLKKEEFLEEFENSKIGVAVFDECHTTVGPEQFSKVSLNVNCYKIIGLSATPFRYDCEDLLSWHLGEIQYFEPNEDDNLLKPNVFIYEIPFGIYSNYKSRMYIEWGGSFNYARYYKKLKDSKEYVNFIVSLIKRAYHAKRVTLVLGNNINTLLKFAEIANLPKEDVGIFIPGTKPKQRLQYSDIKDLDNAFKEKQIVFSTYQACRDGNNRKDLDCLIMTIPTSNVIQAGGRILRQLEGKPTPVIFDIVDTEGPKRNSLEDNEKVGLFVRSLQKRKIIYNNLEWPYKYVNRKNENENK